MKRPLWSSAIIMALATVSLGALPAHAAVPQSIPAAAEATTDPIDPPLYDETADGGTVRVNVVTESRTDLSGAATAGETLQTFDSLPIVTLKVDSGGLDELAAQPGVVSVTEDVPVPPSLDQSVPLVGGAQTAAAGKTGAGSAIAVLDTGVATGHPFLEGRIIAEACFSPVDAEYSATSLCPNGTAAQEGPGTADSETGACATIAGCSHGTHVAGIAAGNGAGVAGAPARGVAPGADIVAVQVFSKFTSEDYCGAGAAPCVLSFTSAQIAGLEKVLELRQSGTPVVAANLSLGAGRYAAACDRDPRGLAIDDLFDAGVATVVASGNNGYGDAISAPACIPSAIAVGSTTDDDQLSSFGNRGPLLDLLAPGTAIVSSVPGDGYASKNGTSMAAPHVAGAFAILREAFPAKSVGELESLLETSGKAITYTGATTPRIDIGKALGGTQPEPEPEPEPATKPRASRIINDADYVVPDPGTVESPITVSGISGNAPGALQVSLDLTHEWLGEVKIDLVDPNGKAYALKTTNGTDPGGTLSKTYTVDASSSPANGTWKLQVQDRSAGADGTLDKWSLTFPSHENQTDFTIPDPGTVESPITVSGLTGSAPQALQVYVDATHEWRGDLEISLVAPNGTTYALKSTSSTETGGTIRRLYTVDASASPANGTWKLRVKDTSAGATGTLTGWSLTFPASYENQTSHTVPDPGTVESPITVSGLTGSAPQDLQVYVDATHEWRGDLEISLVAPNGTTYALKSTSSTETGGTIRQVYTVDAAASPANGTWKLRVKDTSAGATGTLTGWILAF
ncbi:proprotein convertase P-domain-containing protein [Streptomyces sp. DT2A-34]|uniref:proprotein convertase P-domain-containing protein n=1 Tax=Streptomyces sp. DT2A-34 TaxID=3051182 RepID=UPI00265B8A61|nr:proprotein convertase P-domain-containing protein [Streptomyces sp. DT2A-34]MDO0914526.1 proprotein convertase P-domain-containing protein [Streptomyces sp. DT2A-34]